MSTAKSTANGAQIDAADFAAILSTTLAMAAEVGLSVGIRERPASDGRAAGLLIFIEGLGVNGGRIVAHELAPQGIEGHADGGADTAIVGGQDA